MANPAVAKDAAAYGTLAVSARNQANVNVSVIAAAASEDEIWSNFIGEQF